MQISKITFSLCAALFVIGLSACATEVTEEHPNVDVSEGALQQGNPKPGCTQGSVSSPSCEDPGILKDQANAICQADGRELDAFDYEGGACGWQTTEALYECCPAAPQPPSPPNPPPPPPNGTCTTGEVGDGVSCQDYGVLKQLSWDACMQAGLELVDITPEPGGCPAGLGTKAAYACGVWGGVCP